MSLKTLSATFALALLVATYPSRTARADETYEQFLPLEEENVPAYDGPPPYDPPVGPVEEGPFPFGVDEETFAKIKEDAANDRSVGEPDEVVALAIDPKAATVLASLPGLGYDSADPRGVADTVVARSTLTTLEATNGGIRLYRTTNPTIQTKTPGAFFQVPLLPMTDPKLVYDRDGSNPRYYLTIVEKPRFSPLRSGLWLAVSKSPNPPDLEPASWCQYRFDGTSVPGVTEPTFADYPGLAISQSAVVITTNQFSAQTFFFAQIRALLKNALSNNAGNTCPSAQSFVFRPAVNAGDLGIFTIQPVHQYSAPSIPVGRTDVTYLVSASSPLSSASYRVWRLRDLSRPSRALESVTVTGGFTYQVPPNALGPGGAGLLTGDARITQAAGWGDSLWAVHSVLCNMAGGPTESCVRFLRFSIGQDAAGKPSAGLGEQRNIGGGAGTFLWMPGVAVNRNLATALVFLRCSPTAHQGSAWTTRSAAPAAFAPAQVLVSGVCQRSPLSSTNRPGDYVGAQTDPTDQTSFWLAGEGAKMFGTNCQWTTNIVQVRP